MAAGLKLEVRFASRDNNGKEVWELRRVDTGLVVGQWSTRENAEQSAKKMIAGGNL